MAEDESKKNETTEEGAAAEAAPTEAEAALAAEALKSKKKSFRLFLILAIASVCFLSWLIYALRYEVEEPRPDVVETSGQEFPDDTIADSDEDPIAIEPFLVNLIARHKGKARLGQKVLRVRFEVIPETEGAARSIEKFMPKIRDSVNILLSSQDYGDMAMSNGREALRNLIKDQINEVIQPEKIKKVYFIEFVIN